MQAVQSSYLKAVIEERMTSYWNRFGAKIVAYYRTRFWMIVEVHIPWLRLLLSPTPPEKGAARKRSLVRGETS
jgi:hypothetical protein